MGRDEGQIWSVRLKSMHEGMPRRSRHRRGRDAGGSHRDLLLWVAPRLCRNRRMLQTGAGPHSGPCRRQKERDK